MGLHIKSAGDVVESWCLVKTSPRHNQKHPFVHKKLRLIRILGLFLSITAISTMSTSIGAFLKTELYSNEMISATDSHTLLQRHQRNLMEFAEQNQNDTPGSTISMNYRAGNKSVSKGEYPHDIFSLEDRKRGAVVLHIFGMIYMFIALAVVCDEFFVPSLTVITEKLMISDDVAGATFMAAGGSAPELFTSLIGVFISHSNVGIGTIVGSAVFNILFVIGMCAIFSKEVLNLTWWPLFRDVSFYILGLIMLISFFLDNMILWYESLLLLMAYLTYVTFMKFNVQVESWVKSLLNRNKVVKVSSATSDGKEQREQPNILVHQEESRTPQEHEGVAMDIRHGDVNETAGLNETWTETIAFPNKTKPRLQRGGSSASLHNSLMRNSIFQLMIHTLDPLSEGRFKEKASILHKMAKKKCQVEDSERLNGAASYVEKIDLPNTSNVEVEVTPPNESTDPVQNGNVAYSIEAAETQMTNGAEVSEEDEHPLNLSWPTKKRKRAVYLAVLPIVFPLWITLPDVRKPTSRKFFPITFLGSITWIAIFSYLMVWWAHQVGETIGITEEVMGLTILAAGTSIPDLITSVIVARKGLGDMAVSSSVGSNIFDITVGLPVPWLLYSMFNHMKPVTVSSNGLFCAIILLFIMLLFVIVSIAMCRWRMNKILGCMMFGLYMVFLVLSVLLENRIIQCPASV
ncbi:sodium/potassium/calcium exchanger 2 isoform X2 [Pseudophryne corroboree]|uniref:sodium/potassium/calcium exchanger 2 isoform X2 n=1 Tax=Pseudophryne corroboree TaxID=495146 RepID=UPI0030817DC3